MGVPLFDLTRQYGAVAQELESAVLKVLRSGRYILGEVVERFEAEFAEYCGTNHAVGVASGTDALVISLRAAGVKHDDEVILPSFTFFATAEAVADIGAIPVFADVNMDSMCITAEEIERCITPRTKAVIPVHLFGHPAPMDDIMTLAERHGFAVIEDAAQSAGTRLGVRKAGSMGHAGAFSFFPSKNLGAAGDGGMITTDSEAIAVTARKMRAHGSIKRYLNEMLGYNSRLDAVQAALLSVKLRHLDGFNDNRRANADAYRQLMGEIPQIILPGDMADVFHIYHQYTIRVQNGSRDALVEYLRGKDIGTAIYYPVPVHKLGPFDGSVPDEKLPNTMTLAGQVLSLPIFPELRCGEIETVAGAIGEFFGKSL